MLRHFSRVFLSLYMVYCSAALADDNTNKQIIESALRETRDIISRELFGHYDSTNLVVLKIEALQDRIQLGRDYGLVSVTLTFATISTYVSAANVDHQPARRHGLHG